ncbi:MAG TPA: ATP-binding cassette domain-containing protein, partial [Myxococcota bacterium]|nr:ATP-binding cassette domain-containing protein [Myxococcota bacterium]
MPAPAPSPAALELRGIRVRFPGTLACDGAGLRLRAGEVHALVGENGAGKSTLAHVAAGLLRPEAGELRLAGSPRRFASPREAQRAGVAMVFQSYLLVERLSVLDNLLLGWDRARAFVLPRRRLRQELERLAARLGLELPLDARVETLSAGEKQRVALARALSREARVLLLDEPTAVLTPDEAGRLFAVMRRLAAEGVAVLFVSHKLPEILEVADRISVLHRGRTLAEGVERGQVNAQQLAGMMVGMTEAGPAPGDRTDPTDPTDRSDRSAQPRLALDQVSVVVDGIVRLSEVSLALRPGRVCGVAGVAGNGQGELAAACAGLLAPHSGRVLLEGQDVTGRPAREFLARGVGFLAEDRHGEATDGRLTVAESAGLRAYRRLARGPLGWLHPRALEAHAARVLAELQVVAPGLAAPSAALSGGNLQKLLLGRELLEAPRVLLVHQPTQGLDLGAAAAVRA